MLSTRPEEADREFVRSLAKGLAVIECFGPESPEMTLSQVARKVSLSPGSARRVLRTLEQLGYVGSDGQRFRLLPRTLQLGFAYLSCLPLASLVQPRLSALTRELDESSSLAVLDGSDIVYVARATARRLGRDYLSVGMRYPVYATSPGKVLLAALPEPELAARIARMRFEKLTPYTIDDADALRDAVAEARRQGWAVNDQETIHGLRSLAVPVRVDGRVTAALGMSAEVSRVSIEDMLARFLPPMQEAAAALSRVMAASGHGAPRE